jgi:hypothetical protein
MNNRLRSRPPNVKFTAPGSWISPNRSPSGRCTWTPLNDETYTRPALVDLDAIRKSGRDDCHQTLVDQIPSAAYVECEHVVWPLDGLIGGPVNRPAVADVQE